VIGDLRGFACQDRDHGHCRRDESKSDDDRHDERRAPGRYLARQRGMLAVTEDRKHHGPRERHDEGSEDAVAQIQSEHDERVENGPAE
jgi:hypothetical protein